MKKLGLLAILGAATALASCTAAGTPGENGDSNGNATIESGGGTSQTVSSETTYMAQAVMSVNLLGCSVNSNVPLARRAQAPAAGSTSAEAPSIYDQVAEEVLSGIEGLMSIIGFDATSVVEGVSDREGYEKMYQITMPSLATGSVSYEFHLNEKTWVEQDDDEKETFTSLKGLVVMGELEYTVTGLKTVEEEGRGEIETELEFAVRLDEGNYVLISQEMEDRENEYEYTLIKNGREVANEEFSFETDRRGRLVVSLEREVNGQEFEIELLATEDGIKGAVVEVELRNGREIEGVIGVETGENGETVFTLRFLGQDKVYRKAV